MKKIFILFFLLFIFVPNSAMALGNYETKNLEETLAQENISYDFKEYEESSDQAVIYMFRGDGCSYCRSFLNFLKSIVPEYGKYFRLVSYEVYNDKKNSKLMDDLANFLGEEAGGVPFIIIGDKVFPGYASSYDENIKSAIKAQYDSKNSYDVITEYEKYLEESKVSSEPKEANNKVVVFFNFFFILCSTIGILLYQHHTTSKLSLEVKELKEEVKKLHKLSKISNTKKNG